MKNNKEETAFPLSVGQIILDHQGMSLRDYFAAATLTGLYANEIYAEKPFVDLAEMSYRQADAMMETRKTLG